MKSVFQRLKRLLKNHKAIVVTDYAELASSARRIKRLASLRAYDSLLGQVALGRFSGLRLLRDRGAILDKLSMLVGSYEKVVVEKLSPLDEGKRTAIVLGAGEGFYSAGLLVSGIADKTISFEASAERADTCRATLEENGLAANVFGLATKPLLLELDNLEVGLVLVDIEGAEFELLDSDVLDHFASAYWIIEWHDFLVPDESKAPFILRERLSQRFMVEELVQQPPSPWLHRELLAMGEDLANLVLSENRPGQMRWLFCAPKTGTNRESNQGVAS